MMPIVDPSAELALGEISLENYLAQTGQFHVLRMVAVQTPKNVDQALQELQYFQTVATTRGSGGLPNAVVVYCDLNDPDAIDTLLSSDGGERARGVHYCPTHSVAPSSGEPSADRSDEAQEGTQWQKSVSTIHEHELSLDLTLSVSECWLAERIASYCPQLNLIVTVVDWFDSEVGAPSAAYINSLAALSKHENIHCKVAGCCNQESAHYESGLVALIATLIEHVGYGRILLSTAQRNQGLDKAFVEQWKTFYDATASFSALKRDMLFRSNAMRVYRL